MTLSANSDLNFYLNGVRQNSEKTLQECQSKDKQTHQEAATLHHHEAALHSEAKLQLHFRVSPHKRALRLRLLACVQISLEKSINLREIWLYLEEQQNIPQAQNERKRMEFQAEHSLLKQESVAAAEEAKDSILEACDGASVPCPPLSDPNVQAVTPPPSPPLPLTFSSTPVRKPLSMPADAALTWNDLEF